MTSKSLKLTALIAGAVIAVMSTGACTMPGGDSGTKAGGEEAIPKDFPVPLPPSTSEVSYRFENGLDNVQFTCPDSVDLTSKFYKTQLRMIGWNVQEGTETADKATFVGKKGATYLSVTVSKEISGCHVQLVRGKKS